MNPEVLKRLDTLATTFHTTANQLWGMLVSNARVDAIQDGIWIVFWGTMISILMWVLIKWETFPLFKSYHGIEDYDTDYDAGRVGVLLLVIVFIVIVVMFVNDALQDLLNPQYYAFHELSRLLSK